VVEANKWSETLGRFEEIPHVLSHHEEVCVGKSL
jgi:hypothetical protein